MDVGALIAGLQNVVSLVVAWLVAHLRTQEQWLLFVLGVVLVVIGAYSAWRARRMGPYKLSVFAVKLGFGLMFLAIGWDNARAIYEQAVSYFGNPVAGVMAVFFAGIVGYEVVSKLIPKKKG